MARPKKTVRTQIEANLLGCMADAGIEDYSELAEKSGLSIPALQKICSGKADPKLSTLLQLCRALNCTLDDLAGDMRDVPREETP